MGFAADNPATYLPEYGNSISAPWIALLGFYQLVAWKHDSAYLRAISTMFFVNGWGSMLCHVTGFVWWDFCDRMTMVTVAYMSLILVMEEAANARRVTLGCTDLGKEDPLWVRILRAGGYCVCFSAIWFVYVLTLEGCDIGHYPLIPGLTEAVGFGAPIVVILGLVCLERFLWRDAIRASNADVRKAWRMVIAGSIISIIATLIWVLTEQACDTVVFFRWFPGHVFWHLLMPYGIQQIMQFVVFMRARVYNCHSEFVYPPADACVLVKVYRYLFPQVVWCDGLSLPEPAKYSPFGQ